MEASNFTFDVIIATHNRPELLKRAIQSVLNQTYQHFNIAVVNDAGEDVKYITDSFNDSRIHYFSHKINKGLGQARNTGIKNLNGSIIVCLDDDDYFGEYHLQILNDKFNENKYAYIIYTDCIREILQKNDQGIYQSVYRDIPYSIDFDPDLILIQNITPVTSVAFFRVAGEAVGFFDTTLKRYEDHDLWIKISRRFPMIYVPIPTVTFTWRNDLDGNSMSSTPDNLFTTQLPIVYKKHWKTAVNQDYVCENMNGILQARKLRPLFKKSKDGHWFLTNL